MGFQHRSGLDKPITHGTIIWASIISTAVAAVVILLAVIAMVSATPAPDNGIVRWFEDGSGRIELSNGYCTFPAFDSPEDKVECYKEEP